MSEIESLVNEIGHQVGLFTEQLKEEKAHLSELQNKLSSLTQEAQFKRQSKLLLEEEIKQLESTYFRESQHCKDVTESRNTLSKQAYYLDQALQCIIRSNERVRKERMAFLNDCKEKLKTYEEYAWDHEKLKSFVELWARKGATNFQLVDLPESIRTAAKRIERFGETSVGSNLEAAFNEDPKHTEQPRSDENLVDNTVPHNHTSVEDVVPSSWPNGHENMLDSNMIDSSRLRISALDTTMYPSKSQHTGEPSDMEAATLMDESGATASGDVTSY